MDDALIDFDKALRFSPFDVDVLCGRATLLLSLGKKSMAVADVERAWEIEPMRDEVLSLREQCK